MTISRKALFAVAMAVIALAQTGVLAYMATDRVQLLRDGREITLPVETIYVYPGDPLRGDYVQLMYPVGRVPLNVLEDAKARRNEVFYVVLERRNGNPWQPVEWHRSMPLPDGADRLVMRGRSDTATPIPSHRLPLIRYGIESYVVPQGEGEKLQAASRSKKLAVLVAVDKGGNAAIKGLIIDGKLQYEEPLF